MKRIIGLAMRKQRNTMNKITIITLVASLAVGAGTPALASSLQDASTTKSTKGKKSNQDKAKRTHQPGKEDKDKVNGKRTHDPLDKTTKS